MPRGGRRKGAGRRNQWESGCSFEETTVVRVPKYLKDEILELAHRLDAGEEIDLVSKSSKERNDYLENKILELEKEIKHIKNQPKQLNLSSLDLVAKSKGQMNKVRDEILKHLPVSRVSPIYKDEKRKLDRFIKLISEAN